MKKLMFGFSVLAMLFLFAVQDAAAQARQRVRFARGASSAQVSGTIKGYKYIDYVVGARAGQTLSLRITGSSAAQFAVFMADGGNLGMDSAGVAEWSGELPATEDYTIRVLMPRAQARRGETARYTLRIAIR
jgi:hypothetical protein